MQLNGDTIHATVLNRSPGIHEHLKGACDFLNRRVLHLRLDIGNVRVMYTCTFVHLSHEFFTLPHVEYMQLKGQRLALECVSWGYTATNLTLHYMLPKRLIPEYEDKATWDQIMVHLGGDGAEHIGVAASIKHWMKNTPRHVKRAERKDSDLNENPAISIVRRYFCGGKSQKMTQSLYGSAVTTTISNGVIHIMYGSLPEKMFEQYVEDRPMVKHLEKQLRENSSRFPKAKPSDLEALIGDYQETGLGDFPLFIVKDGEVGCQIDDYLKYDHILAVGEVRVPIAMGVTSDDWHKYDEMLEVYDRVVTGTPAKTRNSECATSSSIGRGDERSADTLALARELKMKAQMSAFVAANLRD